LRWPPRGKTDPLPTASQLLSKAATFRSRNASEKSCALSFRLAARQRPRSAVRPLRALNTSRDPRG
jgi:hypothetical protein